MNKRKRRTNERKYFIYAFLGVVLILAVIRFAKPEWIGLAQKPQRKETVQTKRMEDSIDIQRKRNDDLLLRSRNALNISPEADKFQRSRLINVPGYEKTFADMNDIQLTTAERLGVPPVSNRNEANRNKKNLVYIGASPYYYVQPLRQSIPYLVPCAARLLESIAHTFIDSLAVKGIPFHKLIITSVLRTEEDVTKLLNFNQNASTQSCHRFGTTFDISYNRYRTVEDPLGKPRHQVRNDTLKWVLAQVLRDQKALGTCYVKYEVHQGCFHVTVR